MLFNDLPSAEMDAMNSLHYEESKPCVSHTYN